MRKSTINWALITEIFSSFARKNKIGKWNPNNAYYNIHSKRRGKFKRRERGR